MEWNRTAESTVAYSHSMESAAPVRGGMDFIPFHLSWSEPRFHSFHFTARLAARVLSEP